MDAASRLAVEQGADGNRGGTAGLKIANQEIGGLSGGEQAMAEQDVLAFDVDLRGVEDLLGCDVAAAEGPGCGA